MEANDTQMSWVCTADKGWVNRAAHVAACCKLDHKNAFPVGQHLFR